MVSDETQAWFKKLVQDTEQRLGALSDLQDDPERFLGRAELDGVTAVVAPGGSLVDLTLNRASLSLGPTELAATIVRVQREAAQRAAAEFSDAVKGATGRQYDVSGLVDGLDRDALRRAAQDVRESNR